MVDYEPTVSGAMRSFNRLTDPQALSVQPQCPKRVTIDPNMSLEEFNRQYPSGVSLEVLALIDQVEANAHE